MILFITFSALEASYSGSQVRPAKMLAAFRSLGQEVKVLSGEQSDVDARKKEVTKIFKWLSENTPDICYIELPSGPIFGHYDRRLIAKLYKKGVPIAVYYRDAFYRFAPWWNVSGAKKLAVKALHAVDNYYINRYCDIVYFPSRSMSQMFGFKRKDILPPACEKSFCVPAKRREPAFMWAGFRSVTARRPCFTRSSF